MKELQGSCTELEQKQFIFAVAVQSRLVFVLFSSAHPAVPHPCLTFPHKEPLCQLAVGCGLKHGSGLRPSPKTTLQPFCKDDFSSIRIRSLDPKWPCPAPWVLGPNVLDVHVSHSLTAYLNLLPPPALPVLCHTWATPLYP